MSKYIIISDSTCDLSQEIVDYLNVKIQPMSFRIGGKEYKNYLDEREYSLKKFYDNMRSGDSATTSQLNIVDIENFMRPYLEEGYDILNIVFSSGLSGSFNASRLAAEELQEEFPERRILVVDSLCASGGEGVLVYHAAKNQEAGLSLEDNAKDIEIYKLRVRHWFTVSDLEYLRRGGRLSNASAFAAKLLNIKPVLHVDNAGHLMAIYKKMGRKMALNQLITSTIEGISADANPITVITHADCEDEAIKVKEELANKFNELGVKTEFIITKMGPVIGSHAGPGTIAVFTIGNKR